jgi:DNA methylase
MTPGRALILRGDARRLPLPNESVDLICTSPPFLNLRSYTDRGQHYDGQIGTSERDQFLEDLWECTTEMARVLKPEGSIFVELGDSYTDKCLNDIPARYSIGCVDKLGLIKRAEIPWHHVNGLPESVTDRVRRSHSVIFHMVKSPRYYAAIDEIREEYEPDSAERKRKYGNNPGRDGLAGLRATGAAQHGSNGVSAMGVGGAHINPLGKLPGSVWHLTNQNIWDIPSQPLTVPQCRLVWDGVTIRWFTTWTECVAYMRSLARDPWAWEQHKGRPSLRPEVSHFAAYPTELPRRVILGWSPAGICVACGQGRTPVVDKEPEYHRGQDKSGFAKDLKEPIGRQNGTGMGGKQEFRNVAAIIGYACACTPHTNHPGTGQPTQRRDYNPGPDGYSPQGTYRRKQAGEYERVGPWREYHLTQWTPPPTRPAVVVDPFGGTGTTSLVASILGRDAISVDMSQDYSRLARWRTTDRPQVAKAMGVKKPPKPPQAEALF